MTIAGPRLIRMGIALLTAVAALVVSLAAAPSSQAARGMELAIQDEGVFVVGNKRWQGDKPYNYAKALGVTRIRVNLVWAYTMYPAQYSARNRPDVIQYDFSNIDTLVNRAAKHGMRVHLSLTGPAPRWANSRKKQPSGRESWRSTSAAASTATASGTSRTGRPGSGRCRTGRRCIARCTRAATTRSRSRTRARRC